MKVLKPSLVHRMSENLEEELRREKDGKEEAPFLSFYIDLN